jgi:hypothetical protein
MCQHMYSICLPVPCLGTCTGTVMSKRRGSAPAARSTENAATPGASSSESKLRAGRRARALEGVLLLVDDDRAAQAAAALPAPRRRHNRRLDTAAAARIVRGPTAAIPVLRVHATEDRVVRGRRRADVVAACGCSQHSHQPVRCVRRTQYRLQSMRTACLSVSHSVCECISV